MAFDPSKPVARSTVASAELRDNFVALAQHHRGGQAPGSPQLGWVWLDTADSSNWKLKTYTRLGDGASSWKTLFEHVETIPVAASNVDQQQVLYVGKHGDDSNDGETPDKAFLTFGAAITAAGTPASEAAAVTIACLDDGEYDEDLTMVSYVNVYAPNATLKGKQTLVDGSRLCARRLINDGNNGIFEKTVGSGWSYIDVEEIYSDVAQGAASAGIGLIAVAGNLHLRAKRVRATEGDGILIQGTAGEQLVVDVDEWYVGSVGSGDCTALATWGFTSGARIHGRVGRLYGETGSRALASYSGTGAIHLIVAELACAVAYNIGAGDSLRLFVGELSGTETIANAADVRVTKARRDGVKAGVPAATDDENDGYRLFSMVYDSNGADMYICCDPTAGAAVWKKITP